MARSLQSDEDLLREGDEPEASALVLGMSLVTVNRTLQALQALQALRRTGATEFRNGELTVHDWTRLAEIGEFDVAYLHVPVPARL